MELTKKQIGMAIGGAVLLGAVIYFAFIRKTDVAIASGTGTVPDGTPKFKPYYPPAGETQEQAYLRERSKRQMRG